MVSGNALGSIHWLEHAVQIQSLSFSFSMRLVASDKSNYFLTCRAQAADTALMKISTARAASERARVWPKVKIPSSRMQKPDALNPFPNADKAH